eukprot:TRINITY_DN3750_c0_g1_i1.p1 TRINITY_DN3750_c0_g1~~TRINITY_DN3750_c0_g1_i1.p1  ORF type:complete len:279 (+),score=41.86 TRINITY_DN3750_c0_g1_i1:29-865(+)
MEPTEHKSSGSNHLKRRLEVTLEKTVIRTKDWTFPLPSDMIKEIFYLSGIDTICNMNLICLDLYHLVRNDKQFWKRAHSIETNVSMELLSDSDEWMKHCFRMSHLGFPDRNLNEKLSNIVPKWLIAHSTVGIRNGNFKSLNYPDDYARLKFCANWDLVGLTGKIINFNVKVDVFGDHCQDQIYAVCSFEHNKNTTILFCYEFNYIDYITKNEGDEDGYRTLVSLMAKRKEDLDSLAPLVNKNYINTIIDMNGTSIQDEWVLYKYMINKQWPSCYNQNP